jgi:NAD(P)-dependent dehydrogenase (short-subunit alcohol dehydrogenase family)
VRLDGKVALITGAAQGIGEAIAIAFAEQGAAAVAVADLNAEGAAATAERVTEAGARAHAVVCDLREGEQIRAMVQHTVDAFGGLDVLVNNAGVVETTISPDTRIDELTYLVDGGMLATRHG